MAKEIANKKVFLEKSQLNSSIKVRIFSDQEIEDWIRKDRLNGNKEREEILKKWR